MLKWFVVLSLACFAAAAQYPPGQIPPTPGGYPPGQYPPGQYPPNGSPNGSPSPGGISIPRSSKHKKGGKSQEARIVQPDLSAEGVTVSNDGKQLVVHTADGRWLTMTVAPETKWTRGEASIEAGKIVPRTTVHIEAASDENYFLTAVQVNLLKDAPVETAVDTASAVESKQVGDEDLTRPTILHDPVDVPNRPVLRHGKPKETEASDDSLASKDAPARPSPTPRKDQPDEFTIGNEAVESKYKGPGADLLARTREWATSFDRSLPNFVCQQFTTRYAQVSRSEGWQPQDLITAKVVYENGHEGYQDITVGGKKTNKGMLEVGGGSTSTGEFASTLASLFDPGRDTDFKFYRSDTIHEAAAAIYDFKVPLGTSAWSIQTGGQMLRPTYSGSLWVDKSSAQVLRIEMQADKIPKDYPLDTVQSSVDYEMVSLGTSKFLLPVHAEQLSCQRGSSFCSKNTIDFRDYHKYSGESTIVFK